MNKVAVLSRYKEKDDLWENIVSKKYEKVIVYNKYEGENLLPNLGREGHTYIHYIIENYNNLPDEILFSQYDPRDHFRYSKKTSVEDSMNIFLNKSLLDFQGIKACDFDKIVRSRIINWIAFSKELFGEFNDDKIYQLLACGATLNGIFRVSKNAILRNDISIYKKALEMLSKHVDPHEGFYFERIWKFLFFQAGCKDDNYINYNNKVLKFGTTKLEPNVDKIVKWKAYNYGHVKLSEDGTIRSNGNVSFYHHYNESHWLIRDGFLYFLDSCGAATSRFRLHSPMENFDPSQLIGERISDQNNREPNALSLTKPFWE
jgi:hypothetical protein